MGDLAPPLIIDSGFALIPVEVAVLLMVIRTSLEDGMLLEELDGYKEYEKKVRYRLVLGV